jgi:hypothetical protein
MYQSTSYPRTTAIVVALVVRVMVIVIETVIVVGVVNVMSGLSVLARDYILHQVDRQGAT